MKKFITLMLAAAMCVSVSHSQTLLERVGLPAEFSVFENMVISGVTQSSLQEIETMNRTKPTAKYTITTEYTSATVDQAFTGYALNTIHNNMYEFGCQYLGTDESGSFVFQLDGKTSTVTIGDYAGQTYYYGWKRIVISATAEGYDMEITNYPYMNVRGQGATLYEKGLPAIEPWLSVKKLTYNKVYPSLKPVQSTVRYTKAQIEAKLNLDEFEIAELNKRVIHLKAVDPTIYVTSFFPTITRVGNSYYNETLINGRRWDDPGVRNLKMHMLGSPRVGLLNFRWAVYNECPPPAVKASDLDITGSGGNCFFKQVLFTDPLAVRINASPGSSYSITPTGDITFNSNKKCIIGLEASWSMDLKVSTDPGYYDAIGDRRVQTLRGN